MPLSFDDEKEEESPPTAPQAPEPAAGEMAPGQQLYEALAQVVAEQDEATLLALVDALQTRKAWGRLSRSLREVMADLDDRLFVE